MSGLYPVHTCSRIFGFVKTSRTGGNPRSYQRDNSETDGL